ncbi:hypothetical protein [Pseudonocardia sp. ICBG1293]|uniref:hypothetical protein n=1 Tax=Pseudonocardia sp. ICBG1293 TaxID=2844382 RepID=UPI001CCE607D|nr:hypothetical protein [Pseudonocardia sp. ICBG1293]
MTIRTSPSTTTTALSSRYTATSPTAIRTASENPARNTPPSSASSTSVSGTFCPCSAAGASGFCTRWAVASAADRVIVMRKSVAANPSSTSTNTLPRQPGSSRSSIAMEPSPCGLSRATRR